MIGTKLLAAAFPLLTADKQEHKHIQRGVGGHQGVEERRQQQTADAHAEGRATGWAE